MDIRGVQNSCEPYPNNLGGLALTAQLPRALVSILYFDKAKTTTQPANGRLGFLFLD